MISSLLHLVGLQPRVYYTLTNFRGGARPPCPLQYANVYGLYLWGLNCKRLKILQKKAVRILAFKPYISHSTPIFKDMKILQLEDLYTMQLYQFYYKNTNNLLPSYFRSFTPFYENNNHNLRYNILRLPMTRHEYVLCSVYKITITQTQKRDSSS